MSTVRAAARWLAPSVVAACVVGLATGALAGRGLRVTGLAASIGLSWLVVTPPVLVLAAIARGVFAAWQPAALATRLRDEHGAWPQLAGWVGTLWLATIALAWAMFQAIWRLNLWTAFKPLTLSFAAPIAAVLAAVVAIVLARPVARLLATIAAWFDRKWRGDDRRRSLLRPWPIAITALVTLVGLGYIAQRFLVRQRLGVLPIDLVLVPGVGLLLLLLVHAVWPALGGRARGVVGGCVGVACAAAFAMALHVVHSKPVTALAIWARQPIARAAIEKLRALEAIRADVPREKYRPKAIANAVHPDLLLITVGDVRADVTPPYAGRAPMPVLRELAGTGATFAWAFSPTAEPGHAIVDILLGLEDARVQGGTQLDPRHVTLADRLRAGGYETAAFACCTPTSGPGARIGMRRGLDHVTVDTVGARLASTAATWIGDRDRRGVTAPLFVWVHLDLPPAPPASASDDERSQRYDTQLAALDAELAVVVSGFNSRDATLTPLIAIVGDRGTSLGEHGVPDGAGEVYNGEVRVPLIIRGPTIPAQQSQETVSTLDLVPTLLELTGFSVPLLELDGISLAKLARGTRTSALSDGDAFVTAGRASAMIRGTWKYIDRGTPSGELYDVKSDPHELGDQASRRTKLADGLRQQLLQHALDVKTPLF